MDPATRTAILDFILTNYAQNSTILMSTHLINDVERIFNSVLMIGNGEVKLNSTVDEIKQSGKTVEKIFLEVFPFAW